MLKERSITPKLTKGQVVKVSLYGENKQARNDFIKKCLSYSGESGTVSSWGFYFLGTSTRLVYHVRMKDGKVLLVTEDCLIPVNDLT